MLKRENFLSKFVFFIIPGILYERELMIYPIETIEYITMLSIIFRRSFPCDERIACNYQHNTLQCENRERYLWRNLKNEIKVTKKYSYHTSIWMNCDKTDNWFYRVRSIETRKG
jgi:hypothetical protein